MALTHAARSNASSGRRASVGERPLAGSACRDAGPVAAFAARHRRACVGRPERSARRGAGDAVVRVGRARAEKRAPREREALVGARRSVAVENEVERFSTTSASRLASPSTSASARWAGATTRGGATPPVPPPADPSSDPPISARGARRPAVAARLAPGCSSASRARSNARSVSSATSRDAPPRPSATAAASALRSSGRARVVEHRLRGATSAAGGVQRRVVGIAVAVEVHDAELVGGHPPARPARGARRSRHVARARRSRRACAPTSAYHGQVTTASRRREERARPRPNRPEARGSSAPAASVAKSLTAKRRAGQLTAAFSASFRCRLRAPRRSVWIVLALLSSHISVVARARRRSR